MRTGAGEIKALQARAGRLPKNSRVALQLLEQAARLADAAGDTVAGFNIRNTLCGRCYYIDAWDIFFVHFAWAIARHDEAPERFPARRVLWHYKWALENAKGDPNVGIARIEGLFNDFEERMRRAGYSLRPLYQQRAYWAEAIGDLDGVEENLRAWRASHRDSMSDCLVCELDNEGWLLGALGRMDEAIELWIKVLGHPKRCAEVPAITRSHLLQPLFLRGQRRSASAYHRRGYQEVLDLSAPLAHARHLAYEIACRREEAVLPMLERHLPAAVSHPVASDRWHFHRAAAFALDRFASKGRTELPLRLPEQVDVPSEAGRVQTEALRAWFHEQCRSISAAFDQRHGNTVWTDRYDGFAQSWDRG